MAAARFDFGEAIEVERIGPALDALRDRFAAARKASGAARICTLNLVAVCDDPAAVPEVTGVLERLVVAHPGRMFLLACRPDEPAPHLEARVALEALPNGEEGDHASYAELIALDAAGAALGHLPQAVIALLVADQPVCVWWATPPRFGGFWERLAREADRVVLDTAQLGPWDLMRLFEYVKRDPGGRAGLGDLAWARVKPFQGLCARFFDAPALRERVGEIDHIAIAHTAPPPGATPVEAALLGAWVAGRLRLLAQRMRVKVAPEVVLQAVPRPELGPGRVAELVLSGPGATPSLELCVGCAADTVLGEVRAGPAGVGSQRLGAHARDRCWLLSHELQIYGRDPLYEASLLDAVEILRAARR